MKIYILPSEISGDPEVTAMLQAFYSRSTQGIEERLEDLGTDLDKVKEKLKQWYIGYGHSSIADCGNVTIFFEGVSLLAAKILQNHPLYNGQESSTRYIDFANSECYAPAPELAAIQAKWLAFYTTALPKVEASLLSAYPEEELTPTLRKSIKARAFDICRCLIPAGAKTNLSLHVSLRQASEILNGLASYAVDDPLVFVEFRELSNKALDMLNERYPNSVVRSDKVKRGFSHFYDSESFWDTTGLTPQPICHTTTVVTFNQLDGSWRTFLDNRDKYTPVPRTAGIDVQAKVESIVDFGSYRDIQRHRNGYMSFPLLTANFGFNAWYDRQLHDHLSSELQQILYSLITELPWSIKNFPSHARQYAIPLGFNVKYRMQWGLDQLVYFSELRTGETVHPTARQVALKIAQSLHDVGFKTFSNMDTEIGVSVKRGTQDIVKKEQ